MGLLETFQRAVHGGTDWPPGSVATHWLEVEQYRARFDADEEKLFQYNAGLNAYDPGNIFTPVPLAREMARLSAALLFSEEPKIKHEKYAEALESVKAANGLNARLHSAAERVAVEGRRAIRIILDDAVSDEPLIAFADEDQVIWDARHGDFVIGGAVIMERRSGRTDVYRLIEEHSAGLVTRSLFKGKDNRLGQPVELDSYEAKSNVPEFFGLEEDYETGLDVPTLVRWDNVPGGHSDIAGISTLLDRLDEAESLLVDKGRKSVPVTFADETLIAAASGPKGTHSFAGVVFSKGGGNLLPEDGASGRLAETVQPDLQSTNHIEWIRHLRETALMMAGYSLASWGLDKGGSSDSGKALKLRQARTLLTKAGKDRMAVEAITNALAIALAWREGASEVAPYRPEVKLGDGLPEDRMEDAQELSELSQAGAISVFEMVKRLHPDWEDEDIQKEVDRIGGSKSSPLEDLLNNV